MSILRWTSLVLILIIWSACSSPGPELIVYNAKVYTADSDSSTVEAFAISNNRFTAVGSTEEILALESSNTQTIDLKGQPVIPGLIESHAHIMGVGTNLMELDLLSTTSYEEVAEAVKKAASEIPEGEWILGRGWHQDKWDQLPEVMIKGFPINDLLNEAAPNHPVALQHASGHAVLVNNKALNAAGITEESPDPDGGEIIRNINGQPTGLLNETAEFLLNGVIPENTPERAKKALELAMDHCLELGITSFHNAGATRTEIELFEEYASSNKMRIRLYTMLNGRDQSLLKDFYARGPQIGLGNNMLTIRSIKLYGDGALGSRGAWLHEDYTDSPGDTGLVVTAVDTLKKVVFDGLKNGFQVCTHAIGDKANTVALDFYEEAFKAFPEKATDHRFRIEHAQHLIAEDIPRFAELGVIPSMQAIHMSSDRPWAIQRLGIERIREGAYVWQSLLDSGAKVINGTDAPVEPLNPFHSFFASVTRKTLKGTPEEGYEPLQKMTRQQALRSYTSDAAYGAFEEALKGSIEIGKLADFVVLDTDIMQADEMDIIQTKVLQTWLGGKKVYALQDE